MADNNVTASANFESLIAALEKVAKQWIKVATAEEKVAKSANQIVKAFQSQTKALEKLAKAQEKQAQAMSKMQANAKKSASSDDKKTASSRRLEKQTNKTAEALKRAATAQARQTSLSQRFVTQGYTKDFFRGTGANFDEILNYKNAQASLKDFQNQNKITHEQVQGMWKRLAQGDIRAYSGKLQGLQNQLVRFRKAQVNLGASARKMNDAQTDAWAKQVGLTKRSANAVQQLDRGIKQLTISWKSFARLLAVQLFHQSVSAGVRALAEGVRTTIELEKRIGEVQTISQNLPLSMSKWYEGLKGLSDVWGISIINQAEAAYQALSNQVVEGAATLDFLATANKFATVAVTDASTAVNLLTAAINAFGLSTLDTEKIAGQFFKTIELGRVRAEEIATSYGRIAVPAAKLGVQIEELNAAIASSTIQGFKYSEAATAIRNVFLKLIKPTETMKNWFADLGVNSGEALIGTYGFAGALRELDKRAGGSSTELGKLLGRLRAMMGGFLLTGDGLEKFQSDLEEIQKATENYNKALDLILEKPGKQLEIQLNRIKNFFLEITKSTIDWVSANTNGFRSITVAVKVLADSLALLAFAILPKLIAGFGAWLVALGPIGGAIALIGGATVLLSTVYRNIEDNRAKIHELTKKNQQEWADQRLAHIQEIFETEEKSVRAVHQVQMRLAAQAAQSAEKDIREHGEAYEGFRKNVTKFEKAIGKVIKKDIKELKAVSKELAKTIATEAFDPEDAQDFINQRRLTGKDRPDRLEPNLERKYEHSIEALISSEERLRQASARGTIEDFEDASDAIQRYARQAIEYSDEIYDAGGTGAIASGEDFYRSWLRIIEVQKSSMDFRSKKEKEIADQQIKYHENNLKVIKDQVDNVKETTIQELFKEDDPEKIREIFKTQQKSLAILKDKAEEYGVEYRDLGILETQINSLKIFYIAKLAKLRALDHQTRLKQLDEETAKAQKQAKDIWQAYQILRKSTGEDLATAAKQYLPIIANYIKNTKKGEGELDELRQSLHDSQMQRLEEQKQKQKELLEIQRQIRANAEAVQGAAGASAGRTTIIDRHQAGRTQIAESTIINRYQSGKAGVLKLVQKSININKRFQAGSTNLVRTLQKSVIDRRYQAGKNSITKLVQKTIEINKRFQAGKTSLVRMIQKSMTNKRYQAGKTNVIQFVRESSRHQAGKTTNSSQQISKILQMEKRFQAGKASIINIDRRRAGGGPAGIDTQVVAMSPQEMIINPRASRHFYSQLTAMNSGVQRFAQGGSPVTYNVGDIHMHPQKASDVNVVSLGQKMRREIKRGRLRIN